MHWKDPDIYSCVAVSFNCESSFSQQNEKKLYADMVILATANRLRLFTVDRKSGGREHFVLPSSTIYK